jgi:serine/threonine-protein kinase
VLGRYALYDRIASGGMATVHIGRLLGPVGFARTVAIKCLHAQFAQDPEFVSMFLDEARLVARIRHPNVVPTIDVVATDGELFIVMEFVQGESLARLLRVAKNRNTPMDAALATTLMVGVLHGLHAAHEAKSERGVPLGIVHRDISPQNVLVGVDGVARILDFGVAKAVDRVQTTREGQLKGKLAYMAPEQITGTTSRATDIYAASVVLWEAITGRRLFAGDNDAHLMRLVLEGKVDPPSLHVPGLPAALDAITLRGLQTVPSNRFVTARDMACALEEAMPLMAPSKIGAWVENAVGERLSDRSERIAAIESDSAIARPALPVVRPSALKDSRPPEVADGDDSLHTQLSSGSVSAPGRGVGRPSRGARWLFLGGGATIVVGLLWATTFRHASAPSAGPALAAATTSSGVLGASAVLASSSSGVPLPSVPAASGTPALVDPHASASASAVPPRPPAASPPSMPAPRTAPANTCNPPFRMDHGIKVPKVECL